MKKIIPVLVFVFLAACGEQPNRPLTAIDFLDNANKASASPSPAKTILPSASATPVPNNVSAPSASPVSGNNATSGQTVKVLFKGVIYNGRDKTPLEGAVVKLGKFTDTTDAMGVFSIPDVPVGVYVYTVTKQGFKTFLDDAMNIKADYGRTATFISPLLSNPDY